MTNTNKNDIFNSVPSCWVIKVAFDGEMCEALNEEYGKEFLAFKNEEFGMGVFASEDAEFGVYGDDLVSKLAINAYWDTHEEQIKEALSSVTSMDELCGALSGIVVECIMDILRTANAA